MQRYAFFHYQHHYIMLKFHMWDEKGLYALAQSRKKHYLCTVFERDKIIIGM